MTKLDLGLHAKINLEKLLDTRLLIQANSGGGKSWLIRKLCEEAHSKVQIIIIDLEGEFSTLREKFDFILAGKEGDTPADPRSAGQLAIKLLELNVSAIVDLYELPHNDRKRFVRLFLEAMTNAPKKLWHPCLVVIDEVHVFVPEKGESEAAQAVIDLCTRGRKRGFCAVLATQRLSKLHKDAAAECNNKLIGRTSLDIDMKRASEELGFTSKEAMMNLRKLESGEFFSFGPAISDDVTLVKIGPTETTHPTSGSRIQIKTIPPTAKIKALLPKLSDLPAEAVKELKTVEELRKALMIANKELETIRKNPKTSPAVKTEIKRIEIPVIGKKAIKGISDAEIKMRKAVKAVTEAVGIATTSIDKLVLEMKKVKSPMETTGSPVIYDKISDMVKKTDKVIAEKLVDNQIEKLNIGEDPISNSEHRILNAIAWFESIGQYEPLQTAVSFIAGYSDVNSGGYKNPRGSLRGRGYVEYIGDKIALTDLGRALADRPTSPLDNNELHNRVFAQLGGAERKLLSALIDIYPEDISNMDLADRTGYPVTSGGYKNPRGRLRSLGLIEYLPDSKLKAKSLLFL